MTKDILLLINNKYCFSYFTWQGSEECYCGYQSQNTKIGWSRTVRFYLIKGVLNECIKHLRNTVYFTIWVSLFYQWSSLPPILETPAKKVASAELNGQTCRLWELNTGVLKRPAPNFHLREKARQRCNSFLDCETPQWFSWLWWEW